jgi:hypothetical protein
MIIPRIEEKLRSYPHVTYETAHNYLEIPPQSHTGFRVWIQERPDGCTVGFEGWHEEFSDREEALNCFAFGLSDACLLRIFTRGKVDYKWIVLHRRNGEWAVDSETGLFFFPFWRRRIQRDLHNDIIKI